MTETMEKEKKVDMDNNSISICVMSDLHGNLPEIKKPVDLVILCGDQVSLNAQGSSDRTRMWYIRKFKPWAESLPCEKVLFIAGNHDLYLRKDKRWVQENFSKYDKVTYLEDEEYIFHDKKIYGTPYCKKFGNWAFMYLDEILRDLFAKMPNNLDILITHDAPYGVSDILLEKDCPFYTNKHIGNVPLREAIESRNIDYHFHGHLHSTNHLEEKLGITKVYNTSILNEKYELYYNPKYITI